MKAVCVLCLAGVVSAASAQSVLDFTIDPAQSSVDLIIEIDLGGLGGDTDTSTSSLSGLVQAAADDPEAASSLWLHDFFASMDSSLIYNWSLGFLSTADASLVGGTVEYANPGVILGPVPVVGGNFDFPSVPVILGGVMTVNYDIFLFGSGSEVIDLSTLGPSGAPYSGSVASSNGVMTMTSSIQIAATQPLIVNGSVIGDVIVSGTATMVATADIPDCPADFTGDGVLDFFDISAFLTAFSAQDPAADMNGDGAWDFFDIATFLAAFGAGCP